MRHLTLILVAAVIAAPLACKRSETVISDKNPPPSAKAEQTASAAPVVPEPRDVIMTKKTVAEALTVARPHMVDEFDKSSQGTVLLGAWAAKHLQWRDVVVAKDETSHARVQKDVLNELGKRLCTRGTIVQINTVRIAEGTIYVGLLANNAMNLFHFAAARSTGDLVQSSGARFCGIVTGRYDYKNSGGGTGHAVDVVGVFDLPENKTAQ